MPQMTVLWDPRRYPEELLLKLVERAPFYAALALSTEKDEDGKLKAADFIVEVKQPGIYDRNWPEVGIVIEANYFEERAENLSQRDDQIGWNLEREGLAPSELDMETAFVWTRLGVGGYRQLGRKPR